MKKVSKVLFGWFLFAILAIGCAEDGEPGPQGDQGEQGEQGDPGSVDIIYSDWSQLGWNLNNSSTYLAHKMEVPELTSEFVENGGVLLLFVRYENYIYPVPFSGGNDFIYYEIVLPGELNIYVGTDGLSVESSFKEGEYRYVLIPGESSINGRSAVDVDHTDYEAVIRFYNIPS